jgi:hypothetical protein
LIKVVLATGIVVIFAAKTTGDNSSNPTTTQPAQITKSETPVGATSYPQPTNNGATPAVTKRSLLALSKLAVAMTVDDVNRLFKNDGSKVATVKNSKGEKTVYRWSLTGNRTVSCTFVDGFLETWEVSETSQ